MKIRFLDSQEIVHFNSTSQASYGVTIVTGEKYHLLYWWYSPYQKDQALLNTLRPRQNGRHYPDDIFRCIFLNKNIQISIKISPKFVAKSLINNIAALVQIMAWRRPGDKPLS